MKIYELSHKIETMILNASEREEARITRDTRLGMLGVHAGMTPTEDQVAIVHDEIWPAKPQSPQAELF